MNVGLEKLKLLQPQNIHDEIINQSAYNGKLATTFILSPSLPKQIIQKIMGNFNSPFT